MLDTTRAIDLIEASVRTKKTVREMLKKELDVSSILGMATQQNPLLVNMAMRLLSYDMTHLEEKTPLVQAVERIAAAVKLDQFLGKDVTRLNALLQDHGITITVLPGREYTNALLSDQDKSFIEAEAGTGSLGAEDLKTAADFAYSAFDESLCRRIDICSEMTVRKGARKVLIKEMAIEVQEYNRLHHITELTLTGEETGKDVNFQKADKVKNGINISVTNFQKGLSTISEARGKRSGLKSRK